MAAWFYDDPTPVLTVLLDHPDYQQVLQWGDVAALPARVLYEDVLPAVVTALTSFAVGNAIADQNSITPVEQNVPYHRGSPYGGKDWDTSDPTVGDVHQWDIWGGKERPWQEYDHMGGRFVR
jgi:beta-mannosidase